MKDETIRNKVKVFISSREYSIDDEGVRHYERYRIMRRAIKDMLEATNMAQVYVNECECMANTIPMEKDYLRALNEQDICVFIIDNEDDKEKHAEGVVTEYQKAKELNIKSMFVFCDEFNKSKTRIAEEVMTPSEPRCISVHTFDDIPNIVYKSVLNDIIKIYRDYCCDTTSKPRLNIDFAGVDDFTVLKSVSKKILGITATEVSGSDFDVVCTTLLSYVIYEKDYDETVLEKLESELLKRNNSEYTEVIKNRIAALKYYLAGDVNQCYESLKVAYEKARAMENFPNWLLLDILIDLRTISYELALENGLFAVNKEWQDLILENKETVYYPVLDRYVQEHFQNIDNFLREHEMENPYATRFGQDVTPLLDNCTKAFAVAVSNASLTQMLCIKERLVAGISAVCRVYTAHDQFMELLRLLTVDAKDKDIDRYLNTFGFVQNGSGIIEFEAHELLNSVFRIAIEHKRTRAIIALFKNFGYFFSDEDYILISGEISKIMDRFLNHDKGVADLADSITKAIKSNIHRIDVNSIVDYIIRFTEFNTPFVRGTTNLLLTRSFENLSIENRDKLVSAYIASFNCNANSEIDTILQGLTALRQHFPACADKIDGTIKSKNESYYYSYHALVCNLSDRNGEKIDHVSRLVNEAHSCNERQGQAGLWIGYASDPLSTLSNIIKDSDIDITDEKITEIVKLAEETLLADTQTCSAKISAIELLLDICNYCGGALLNGVGSVLLASREAILTAKEFSSTNKDSRFLLNFDLILLYCKLGKDISSDLVSATSSPDLSDYDYIKMSKAFFVFSDRHNWKNVDRDVLIIIWQFVLGGCRHKNYEVRLFSIRILFELLRSDFVQAVSEQISSLMDNAGWELANDIIYNMKKASEFDEKLKNFVLQKAKTSNHYLVKKAVIYFESE